MKSTILSLFLLCLGIITSNAQISEKQLKPFIPKGFTIKNNSGEGLKQPSGDILLEMVSNEEDESETLLILQNENGELKKIAENKELLMGRGLLGNSGGASASLEGNILSANYSLGSNSGYSQTSIQFKKNSDGQYYFDKYIAQTQNYSVENLFARESVTAAAAGHIKFSEATEERIRQKLNKKAAAEIPEESRYKTQQRFLKYIPKGLELTTYAEGDLNLDSYKNDFVLIINSAELCKILILLQQKDSSYKIAQSNKTIISTENNFNTHNLRVVLKNGYFTIEQRIPINEQDFDHIYLTFKYDTTLKNWFLHRFDVEHYLGFHTQPSKEVLHLTNKDFGKLSFAEITQFPGVYTYDPSFSIINGTITKKLFYGAPSYGETPEKDEKVWTYILKTGFPINVFGEINPEDPENADRTISNVSEIQIYSTDKNFDLKKIEGKKVNLQGVFQSAQSGHQFTKVIFQIKKIL